MRKNHFAFFALFFILTALYFSLEAPFTSAYLAAGVDVVKGNATIDIGYDPAILQAQGQTFFLVSLHTPDDMLINSSSLWVRIANAQGTSVLTATLLADKTGAYTFTFAFPSQGNYTFTTRFQTDNGPLETSTQLEVTQASTKTLPMALPPKSSLTGTFAIIIAVLVLLCIIFIMRGKASIMTGTNSKKAKRKR